MALAEILDRKRLDVAERMAAAPLTGWQESLAPSDRSLLTALRADETAFILECKQASPSEGHLRPDYDVLSVARSYAPFATAISVLTDEPFFKGSFEQLRQVRSVVSQPVLCKDFVIDPYQVFEARRHGADAVLLMLSVLDDDTWRLCHEAADVLALDVLTEVHDERELRRAVDLGATIIGINNRNLSTLKVDVGTTHALSALVPSDRFCISESGLDDRQQVRALLDRVHGFLIGSALMKSAHLERSVRDMIFGPVKVCGLTRAEDAEAAWRHGATWGGLIFHPQSPRQVDKQKASRVSADVPLQWVGVFVDAPVDIVAEHAHDLRLSAVQLHGDEGDDYVRRLRGLLPSTCAIWKAYRIQDALPASTLPEADRVVFDSYPGAARGGTGVRWNWSLLEDYPQRDKVLLSGGLSPVSAWVASRSAAWGLDVNSGVESQPGQKDAGLIGSFFQQIRQRR